MLDMGNLGSYKIDLHLHSYISDGELSPEETLKLCKKQGMTNVSFVEHNFIAEDEAYTKASKKTGVEVVPGVEISTVYNNKSYHLLGYFRKFPDKEINKKLRPLVEGYERRAQRIIKKCQKAGIPINYHQVRGLYNEIYLSKYAIAEQICRAMNLSNLESAFKLAREKGNLLWVEDDFDFYDTVLTIELIHKYNGVAILAHPGSFFRSYNENSNWKQQVQDFIGDLHHFIKYGLDGIEVYFVSNTLLAIKKLESIASENNLLTTGGSDWHGFKRLPDHPLGSGGMSKKQFARLVDKLGKP